MSTSVRQRGRTLWRPIRTGLAALLLVVGMVAGSTAVGSPATAADPRDKVEKKVLEQTAGTNQATFWAILREKADLGQANGIQDRTDRGKFVIDELGRVAKESQSGLRTQLTKRGVQHQSFWIINAIRITAGADVLNEVAADPGVERIVADRTYEIPEPQPAESEPAINAVEWNIDRIRAPQVWSTFGDRGEGIVVANIDTGVQFNHPALVGQYRGNQGGGTFDHNYNWFDPSRICGNPSLAPCDNNGHGTHTMGTMAGDDGDPGTNQIGVAPHAKWIAAKGCESSSCSTAALLAAGQWVLAPTDLNGQNPRVDLRPHIVNNSWGNNNGSDTFYQATVRAWVASGIFPSFSNGNAGPGCGSVGAPASYAESYGVGAFDINNNIASFSSRGPSPLAGVGVKPDISAPGVAVRSSVPSNSYTSLNGTSMASPHLAGTVALMWSAAPTIARDIAATRAILDSTAVDTSDLTCGGTAADNNVWGEGRLDAFAAVDQSPRGPTGTLTGTVTNASDASPISGATIHVAGPVDREATTNASGQYSLVLPVGSYDVTATAFGFQTQTANGVVISEGAATTRDFALQPAPSRAVSGHVRDSAGEAIANAKVSVLGTPIAPATTDANGAYSFASVPEGEYDVRADAGGCNEAQTQHLVVDGDESLDFALPLRRDSFGYFCHVTTSAYVEAGNVLPLTGDNASTPVTLPFLFTYYGKSYSTAHVSTNGFLNFLGANTASANSSIPSAAAPNAAIYAFWDDLVVDAAASVRTQTFGSAPSRTVVVEWRNVQFLGDSTRRVDAEIILHENGHIQTEYRNIADDGREKGNSATLGIENESGTVALQHSFNTASVGDPAFGVLYRLPPSGFAQGTVTNANDHEALAGASVRALQNGSVVRSATTDAAGRYRMQLPLGTYTIEATANSYSTESAEAVLDQEDKVLTRDFALRTARGEVTPTSLQLIVPPNETRTRKLTLRNTGTLDMSWEARETGGSKVTTSSTSGLVKNPEYDPDARTTEGMYLGGTPGGWSPSAPGNVIRSWSPSGLSLAWGVGYTGNVWLSDVPTNNRNHEFSVTGTKTGRNWPAPWSGSWPGDMAYDAGRGLMCQVAVGADNGIHCWNPNTGAVVASITGSFPWTSTSQRGLAYRPDDDTFYIGGWNQRVLYHVKGLSHPDKGAVISQCSPADGAISGLAWNPAFNVVWAATNTPTDTIYQLNPDNCGVLGTLPHPSPGFAGGGLEMDEAGNLWMIDQSPNTVYLIDSGVPAFVDVPWVSESPASGTLAPGAAQEISVTVDTTGLEPGVYNATVFIQTNSARQSTLKVPISLIVPAYQQGVDVAATSAYLDGNGDTWARDQAYAAGSWGYVSRGNEISTRSPISGTDDDSLYQSARRGQTEYRFDGLSPGVYQVDLRFAEIQNNKPGQRQFDVIVEGKLVLPAFDIAGEVGLNAANDKNYFVEVTDGQLNIRLVTRQADKEPIVNAIRVTDRPDR